MKDKGNVERDRNPAPLIRIRLHHDAGRVAALPCRVEFPVEPHGDHGQTFALWRRKRGGCTVGLLDLATVIWLLSFSRRLTAAPARLPADTPKGSVWKTDLGHTSPSSTLSSAAVTARVANLPTPVIFTLDGKPL